MRGEITLLDEPAQMLELFVCQLKSRVALFWIENIVRFGGTPAVVAFVACVDFPAPAAVRGVGNLLCGIIAAA